MTIGSSWKKIIAGTLAVLVVAGAGTANVSFDKLFGGIAITASAAEYDDVSAFNSASEADPVLKLNQNVGEIYITRADGTVDLNGYTVTNLFLQNNDPNKTVTVKNGTVSNKIDGQTGWNADYAGKVVLEDLTVKGNTWIDGHNVTIKSGEYNTIQNGTNFSNSPKSVVNIEGGSFTNLVIGSNGEKYSISGGTFANKPEESYLAEGFSFVQNENEEFVVVSLVTGIEFDKTELTMDYGDTAEISYIFSPENATNKHFVIEVADNDILDWDFVGTNGIELTGKKAGTTTVKVTADNWNEDPSDDVSAVCTVTVNKIASSCKVGVIGTQPYTGEPLQLVESAEAEGGELVYAIGDEKGASEPYTAILPKATEAGEYYVWYKVIGDENHLDSLEVGEKSVIEAPVSEKIDLSEGTVTVDTENKTVSVEVDGETVPESEYHVIYFTYEEIEGGETVTRVGTEYPTEPGTYIAAVVANEDSELYTGENRSQPFTVEAAAEDSSESTPDSKSDTSKAEESKSDTSKAADSSSKAAAAATTSNPATGAAAAGISAAALAAAALVVVKRKKD